MKKIILMLLIILPNIVSAVSYTDYELTIKDSDEYLEETDLLKREEYKEYNTYELKKHYTGYFENCSLYDKDDFYTEAEFKKASNNTGAYEAIHKEGKVYEIDFVSISSLKANEIYEISITHNGTPIEFTYTTNKIDNPEYMHDNDLNTKGVLSKYANIHFYFDPIDFTGLTININGKESILVNTCRLYYLDNNESKISNIAFYGKHLLFVSENEYNDYLNKYGEYQVASGAGPFYLYQYTYYHCYDEVKETTGVYKREGDNLILDDYHTKYNYYERKIIPEVFNDYHEELLNNEVSTVSTTKKKNKKITTTKPINYSSEFLDIPVVEPLSNKIPDEEYEGIFWPLYLLILIIIIIIILIVKRLRKEE